ncbi:MAG TPA: hypothetical protein VH109_07665 [Steroidobacteraceae bacterium]|jgi:hypothetical protein|nr:hypothetical protein [Steroidobacteraceae bacterium]
MKNVLASLTAVVAMSLTALAYGVPPDPNTATEPTTPAPADAQSAQSAPPQAAPSAGTADTGTRLAAIVPKGMDSQEACHGFASVTDCALTLHVAQNLNISFADLKSKLASGQSLIAAISDMKPGVDPQAEVQKAEAEARSDMGPG